MKPANNAPVYASIYHELAEVARSFGYTLAVHGSLSKDFDLIAVPWVEGAASPEAVIAEIEDQFALKATGGLVLKPHGRLCQTMVFAGGDTFLDLSFMPRGGAAAGDPRDGMILPALAVFVCLFFGSVYAAALAGDWLRRLIS